MRFVVVVVVVCFPAAKINISCLAPGLYKRKKKCCTAERGSSFLVVVGFDVYVFAPGSVVLDVVGTLRKRRL